jgi:hypothetical protein
MSIELGRVSPATARRVAWIVVLAGVVFAILVGRAGASTGQVSIQQDDTPMLNNPGPTLTRLRLLGVDQVRIGVRWLTIAPSPGSHRRPSGFHAISPAAYPAANWVALDTLVRDAQQDQIAVNFNVVGGAPLWATGPGAPKDKPHPNWEPSPSEFGSFVRALGTRYSGIYDPVAHANLPGNPADLPAVRFWSIWNEPDYGPSLGPQGAPGHLSIERSPWIYRNLVDAGWTALHATGHAHDTFLFGEVAPRGYNTWGLFSGMKPMRFIRALYCVDSKYRELRGAAAGLRGCPTNAAGSRRFRAMHPALFQASGFSNHPYSRWYPPNVEATPDPDYSVLAEIGVLTRGLDRVQRVYGSHERFPIWNTEYGYITGPPKHPTKKVPYISPAKAAYYINWAEYISWRNPRIESFAQFLLSDPLPALASNAFGGFASGLLTFKGAEKPTYGAFRLPVYLPVTSTRRGRSLEVWGSARPTYFSAFATEPFVSIELQSGSHGSFTTVKSVKITNPQGYFDTRVTFPSSGTVRLTWWYPPTVTDLQAVPVYSRYVKITIH